MRALAVHFLCHEQKLTMNAPALSKREIIDTINNLPSEILPELASYLDYLKFKIASPAVDKKKASGNNFLLSIAGLGESEESLSECDEDILRKEIDPVRGWGLDREGKS